jgi:spiro-SPASM protein
MKTLILDGLFIYKDLPNIFDNKTSLEIISDKAKTNGFDRYILIQNGKISKIPDNIKNIVVNDFTVKNILSIILKESKDTDIVCVVNAANPLYDPFYVNKLVTKHEKYIADYTYPLGYPNGLTCEVVRKDIIKELIELFKESNDIREDYFYHAIAKDINSFDIETDLSDHDLRIYRINFGLKDIGEEIFTKTIYDIFKNDFSVERITEYLSNNIDKIYTTIYCSILDITNYSPVTSIYYPVINESPINMDFETAKKLIDQSIDVNNEINFIIGGFGEPMVHPEIITILKYLSDKKAKTIVETTGYNIDIILNDDTLDKSKFTFVIKIDSYEEQTYNKIHTGFDFKKASDAYNALTQKGYNTYKMITRMLENEIEIEKFIRNKETDKLIIRKFSTYCQTQPDKKVVDLSPLERIPCFHLRRELYCGPDGKIYACNYSRFKEPIGDIKKEDLKSILNKLQNLYMQNANKNYLDFCKNCDDYYIFNF